MCVLMCYPPARVCAIVLSSGTCVCWCVILQHICMLMCYPLSHVYIDVLPSSTHVFWCISPTWWWYNRVIVCALRVKVTIPCNAMPVPTWPSSVGPLWFTLYMLSWWMLCYLSHGAVVEWLMIPYSGYIISMQDTLCCTMILMSTSDKVRYLD